MCFSDITTRHNYQEAAEFMYESVHFSKDKPIYLKFLRDCFRNLIFDMASIDIGLVSENAINSGKKKSKLTKEHIYPRSRQAIKIINMILDGATVDEVREMLLLSCQVVITTKEENISLVPLQKREDYFWKDGYAELGIKMKEYTFPSSRQKWVYKVDGIVYNSIQDAADAHGCTLWAAQQRFTTEAKKSKFEGWTRHEAESQSTSASC